MTRRTLGLSMVGLGLVMIVIGIVALGGSDDAKPSAVPATSTTTTSTTATTTTTTTTTTTVPETTTSTSTTTTTTTTTPPPSVEEFVADYAAATEAGDAEFLFDRLLPGLRDAFGPELCRTWVDREILAISSYRLTGPLTGPESRTLVVGDTSISVSQYFEGPVSFDFQGQSFDTVAQWVIADGQVYWIGECR